MKLRSNLVLVKMDAPEEADDDGIFTADSWKTLPPTGEVTEAGTEVTICKKGDRVFIERYSGIPTPFGENIRLFKEDAVFAVL